MIDTARLDAYQAALDDLHRRLDALSSSRHDAEFEEQDYPRDEDGKFTSGGGAVSKATELTDRLVKSLKPESEWNKSNFKISGTGIDKFISQFEAAGVSPKEVIARLEELKESTWSKEQEAEYQFAHDREVERAKREGGYAKTEKPEAKERAWAINGLRMKIQDQLEQRVLERNTKKFGVASAKDYKASFDAKARNALSDYVNEDKDISARMSESLITGEVLRGDEKRLAQGLDQMFQSPATEVREPFTTYRGTSISLDDLEAYTSGTKRDLNFPQFASTSLDRSVAEGFARRAAGGEYVQTLIEIEMGRGSRGVVVGAVGGSNSSVFETALNEKEVLFPRNARLRVKGIEKQGGQYVIKAFYA